MIGADPTPEALERHRSRVRNPAAPTDLVCVGLALLLFLALFAKVQDFAGSVAAFQGRRSVFSHLATVGLEGALAAWLISGFRRVWSHDVALCYFAVAFCIATWRGLGSEPTCGCFGAVPVSPWLAAGIDVLAVLALLAARRKCLHRNGDAATGWAPDAPVLAVGLLGALIAYASTVMVFGSPSEAVNWFNGDRLSVLPRLIDLGHVPAGERRSIDIELLNLGQKPTHIVGARAACNCVVVGGLPATIPAGASRRVSLVVSPKAVAGKFSQLVVLFRGDGSLCDHPACLIVAAPAPY